MEITIHRIVADLFDAVYNSNPTALEEFPDPMKKLERSLRLCARHLETEGLITPQSSGRNRPRSFKPEQVDLLLDTLAGEFKNHTDPDIKTFLHRLKITTAEINQAKSSTRLAISSDQRAPRPQSNRSQGRWVKFRKVHKY